MAWLDNWATTWNTVWSHIAARSHLMTPPVSQGFKGVDGACVASLRTAPELTGTWT